MKSLLIALDGYTRRICV